MPTTSTARLLNGMSPMVSEAAVQLFVASSSTIQQPYKFTQTPTVTAQVQRPPRPSQRSRLLLTASAARSSDMAAVPATNAGAYDIQLQQACKAVRLASVLCQVLASRWDYHLRHGN